MATDELRGSRTLEVRVAWYPNLKRAFDLLLIAIILVPVVPLVALIAVAIKLDSRGPVLFRQTRVGQHGKRFEILKFRTMIPERRLQAAGPPGDVGERRRVHKSYRDPRVTRVGRILRRTCLDELPQIWNVVAGDMSLVGPRPELPQIVSRYEPWQHARHLVRPGLTGWWQVKRDGRRLMHEDTALDIYYVQNQSFALDVYIMFCTLGVLLRGSGAF